MARAHATTSPASPTAPRPRAWACRAIASLREVERIQAQEGGGPAGLSGRRALVSGHRRTQLGNAGLGAGGLPVPRQGLVQPHEQSGLRHRGLSPGPGRQAQDPRALPLAVSINPYINETSALADYIVPDTVTYESWGMSAPWADVIAKASTVRWPAVQPRVARTATDEPVCLETFLIACAKRLGMPGFGAGAITDKDGAKYALDTPRTSSCAAWPTSPTPPASRARGQRRRHGADRRGPLRRAAAGQARRASGARWRC